MPIKVKNTNQTHTNPSQKQPDISILILNKLTLQAKQETHDKWLMHRKQDSPE